MAKYAAQSKLDEDMLGGSADLEDLIGYNLKRAYIIVQDDFRKALGDDGMTPRVFSALSLTVKFPNITQSELAQMMGIERSGLVAIVDKLEAQNYLKRAPVPGDRRVQALVPTPEGQQAYSHAIKKVRAHEDALFSDMPAAEKKQLLTLLHKIRQKEAQA